MGVKTCMGCRWYQKVMIRGQWSNICTKNMITAPFATCRKFEARFERKPEARQPEFVL